MAPVGAAEGVDAPGSLMFVEHIHNRLYGHVGVIPMEQIEVDVVGAQAGQRVEDVGSDVEGRDPPPVLAVMCALADDDDLLAHAPGVHPPAKGALVVALTVDVRRVEGIAAQVEDVVQQLEAFGLGVRADYNGALHKAGNGFVDAGDLTVTHVNPLFRWGFGRRPNPHTIAQNDLYDTIHPSFPTQLSASPWRNQPVYVCRRKIYPFPPFSGPAPGPYSRAT